MKLKRPSIPYIIWMVVFTMIPLLLILFSAFTDRNGTFSLEAFSKAFGYFDVFLRSLWIAFISTLICLILAYPIAYIMSRQKRNVQNALTMIIMIPMWMNFLLRIYAWLTLLQNGGPVDTMLSFLGIHTTLLGNQGAVILGMVYEYLPFMVLPLYSVMAKIDNGLIEAAEDLGSNKIKVMRKVVFPLSIPGIVSGITMVFVPSVSTFYISQKLGGGTFALIGDVIEMQFQISNNFHFGAALSLVLMILILICMAFMNRFSSNEDVGGGMVI